MKINRKNYLLYLGLLCLFYIPFNISLSSLMYPGTLMYIFPFTGCVCIWFYSKANRPVRIKRSRIYPSWGLWTLFLFLMFIRNQDIVTGVAAHFIYFLLLYATQYVLRDNAAWYEALWDVVKLYCFIHLFAGLFLLINKSFLLSSVVPLFKVGEKTLLLLKECISKGYMTGLTYHYSTMGMYMALGSIATSAFIFRRRKREKSDWIAFVLMFLGLLLTGKRGPLLFVAISVVIVYFSVNNIKNRKIFIRTLIGILLVLCLLAIAYVSIPQVRAVFERFTANTGTLNDMTSGRIEYFWENAWNMFLEHPLFGGGWRAFRYNITTVTTLNANDAHNIYLQLLADVGIVGFTIALIFFVIAWKSTLKAIKKQRKYRKILPAQEDALILSLVYQTFFLLYGMTGNPLYDAQCYFPYFVSCAVGFSAKNYLDRITKIRGLLYE